MVIMASGITRGRVTHDGDDNNDDDDGVAQHGGHTPNDRLTETCNLGLQSKSLILDIHVMIN